MEFTNVYLILYDNEKNINWVSIMTYIMIHTVTNDFLKLFSMSNVQDVLNTVESFVFVVVSVR